MTSQEKRERLYDSAVELMCSERTAEDIFAFLSHNRFILEGLPWEDYRAALKDAEDSLYEEETPEDHPGFDPAFLW